MKCANPFKMLKQSFQTRVFFLLTLLILIISIAFTTFYVRHESASQTERLVMKGELLAQLLAYNSRIAVFAEHGDMLRDAADGILQHDQVLSAAIFSAGGKLLASRSRTPEEGNMPERQGFSGTLRNLTPLLQGKEKTVYFEKDNRIECFAPIFTGPGSSSPESLYFSDSPTEFESQAAGIARVVLDKKELNAKLHELLLTGLLLTALFLAPALVIAFKVAQGVTRPLERLLEGVRTLERGNLSARILVETEDELGEVSHAFNAMSQTLELREAENRELGEQLRHAQEMEAKEEWERTFDTVPDLIAILDGDQRIVRINKAMADRLGITKEQGVGTRLYERLHWTETPSEMSSLADLLAGGATYSGEVYQERLRSFFFVTVSPLRRNDGSMIGSVYVARDITGQKRAEEEQRAIQAKLVQTNKMTSLGLMVSGLAHEVNNPNNNIKLTAHLLAKSWQDILPILENHYREEGNFNVGGQSFDQVKEILPQHILGIRENSRRIEGIIKNLRDFARKGAANINFKAEVNTIVSVAASLLNIHIKKHTRHFKLKLQEGLPIVRGNPQQLEQVVINLIMNAIQALPDKERTVLVSTSLDRQGGFVVITVADEGEGMPPEVKARICEPFFSTKLDHGGTGLGLAISNFIVKEHNGFLEFESAPGKGTTARVKLPAEVN